ncbi:efflux RND transporter periplasmic adaptor subunit [Falsirhodobacter sp. 20TX0035]|uniref:efflux RND transporter periplasmic adaptor subunit n=1 Tax=Falsirhodobacter sp. 20TX0035 TaxID=3022019 RepID=UPI00232CB89E|nr:HlyD family secretion protein [Falsirhodobacter sp. 20TX0035]MDB6454827.1 HlyD family secretion protein [Falsirhodobacter sp. 20TX0035]
MILIRLILTTLIAIAAAFGGIYVWNQVFRDPWTRDAHIRADLIQIAPLVSGAVVEVEVTNNANVAAGDLLMKIDPKNYELALSQAEASLASARANAENSRQQADRLLQQQEQSPRSVAEVELRSSVLSADAADAQVRSAEAALDRARLDLTRTEVRAPRDGQITNLTANVGDYAAAGANAMVLVAEDSFRVDAFFMETQIQHIRAGDPVRVHLMASGYEMPGRVLGISSGISYAEDMSQSLLQAPTPSFQWIRLAQRIPVEIALDRIPDGHLLANGMTASVTVDASGAGER